MTNPFNDWDQIMDLEAKPYCLLKYLPSIQSIKIFYYIFVISASHKITSQSLFPGNFLTSMQSVEVFFFLHFFWIISASQTG